jgi:hypothetical protein
MQDVSTLITALSLPYKGTVIDNQLKGESNSELNQFLAELPKLLSKLGTVKKVFKFIIEHPSVRGTRVGRYWRALQYHLANNLGEPIHLRRIRFVRERTNELLPEFPLRVRFQVRSLDPGAITIEGHRRYLSEIQDQIRREADVLFPIGAQENANAAPNQPNHAPLDPPVQVGARRHMNEVVPEERNERDVRRRMR